MQHLLPVCRRSTDEADWLYADRSALGICPISGAGGELRADIKHILDDIKAMSEKLDKLEMDRAEQDRRVREKSQILTSVWRNWKQE